MFMISEFLFKKLKKYMVILNNTKKKIIIYDKDVRNMGENIPIILSIFAKVLESRCSNILLMENGFINLILESRYFTKSTVSI